MSRSTARPTNGAGIAFFDVDGTLSTASTMHTFLRFYLGRVGSAETDYFRWIRAIAAMSRRGYPREHINASYVKHFVGVEVGFVAELATQWLASELRTGNFYHEPVLAELRRHRRRGDRVVLVSGALSACLRVVAEDLAADEVCCAEPEVVGGRYTGALSGPPMIGTAKAAAAMAMIRRHGLVGTVCSAYGDHISDLPLLRMCGAPTVIAGDPQLSAVASSNGWRILPSPGLRVSIDQTGEDPGDRVVL